MKINEIVGVWPSYNLLCRNKKKLEAELGMEVNKTTLFKLIKSGVISKDLPFNPYKLIKLNNIWVPIDVEMADTINTIHERGYIVSNCSSGHIKENEYYDRNYFIEFAEEQPKINIELAFALMFGDIMGSFEYEDSTILWNQSDPNIESNLVLLNNENTNIYKGTIKGKITRTFFHIAIPQKQKLNIPKEIKSITLCRKGNIFTFRAIVENYQEIHYINEYLLKILAG